MTTERGRQLWPGRHFRHHLRASVRDTFVLLREFRGALIVFVLTLLLSALLWHSLSQQAGLEAQSFTQSLYVVLSMIFFQANIEFPDQWYLQAFFFLMPLVGLGVLGRGVADFGALLFNRQLRGKAWQEAVAETYSNHVILVGLGHLGFRVARELHNLDQDVVAIERDPKADLLDAVQEMDFPIIAADATNPEVMKKAGIERARAIILCTSNDVANLQMALRARALNEDIRVIVRLFDDDFAREVQEHFSIDLAYSASALAAPAFAGSAITREDISRPITIEGQVMNVGRYVIRPGSPFNGYTVHDLEHEFNASIVTHRRGGAVDMHPGPEMVLLAGDKMAILADPRTLALIGERNRERG